MAGFSFFGKESICSKIFAISFCFRLARKLKTFVYHNDNLPPCTVFGTVVSLVYFFFNDFIWNSHVFVEKFSVLPMCVPKLASYQTVFFFDGADVMFAWMLYVNLHELLTPKGPKRANGAFWRPVQNCDKIFSTLKAILVV